jgi:hypothetical protein
MAKYHINDKGNPGKCTAQSGNCPFGDDTKHYSSKEEARNVYENKMVNEQDSWGGTSLNNSILEPE